MRDTADAVVIGGGIHGCSIAYHLAAKGFRDVVLVEKDFLTAGGTGRSAAGIRHQFGTEVNIRLASASVRRMEGLAAELDYEHGIELVQKGYLMLAYSHGQIAQFRADAGLQKAIDPQNGTVILTAQEIHELNPYLCLEGVVGGSFNPDDGHINPWHTTYAFARAAGRLGVEINPFTEVKRIIVKAGGIQAVDTTRGRIWTPVVVDAAGPWGALIADMVGVCIPLEPQRHQILVTEPVEEIIPMMVLSFTHGTYFKQTPHGGVLMGYGDPEHEVLGLDQRSTWDFVDQVARKILYHMPILKDVRVVRQWAGLYDMTPDSQAILGPIPDVKGFYIDVGWSGHGLQLAPSVGRIMAELIAGEEPFIDVRCLRHSRFAACELIPEPACV